MTSPKNSDENISNGTRIFVFGNPDIEIDSLPVKLLPKLVEQFKEHTFTILDPNEEWDVPRDMVIIDTVVGIKEIAIFKDLSAFVDAPKVTCHDFDAYTNLQFLKKLGVIDSTYIIGIPTGVPESKVLLELKKAIKSL